MAESFPEVPGMRSRHEVETTINGLEFIEKGNESLVSPVIKMYREKLQYMKENKILFISKKELDVQPEKKHKIKELLDEEIDKTVNEIKALNNI